MQNKKWILGVMAAAVVCVFAASMWPIETGAVSDHDHPQTTEAVTKEEKKLSEQAEDVVMALESGQAVGSIEIPIAHTDKEPNETVEDGEGSSAEAEDEVLRLLYAKKAINLREKMTTKSKKLAVTSKGDPVELLEEPTEDQWCKVRFQGKEGYLKYYHLADTQDEAKMSKDNTKNENKEPETIEPESIKTEEVSAEGEVDESWEYLGNYYITGYRMFNAAENGGRSDGVTASGVVGTPGHTVAMKGIPFGTTIYVDGLGYYVVEDRGVGEGCVDIACNTKKETYELTGYRDVYIVE